jgi:hypothetical protein
MEKKMIMVKSGANCTLGITIPELNLRKTWTKKGTRLPIDRDTLFQACYDRGVETMIREGILIIEDREFLIEAGFLTEEEIDNLVEITDAYVQRIIKNMPLSEVKKELKKLSPSQIDEIVNYAIEHYTELNMDRIDLFTKVSGKNVMKAITNYKAAQED